MGRLTAPLMGAVLAAVSAVRADDGEPLRFSGELHREETVTHPIGDGYTFELVPDEYGWRIAVRDPARPKENLARLTPPWHFVPNPRFIEGWHFRNRANTGPNEGSVNAPQHEREFIFSPEVGRTVACYDCPWPPTSEQMARVRAAGRGVLTIEDMRLGNLVPGERAHFEWMRFRVEIHCAACAAAAK